MVKLRDLAPLPEEINYSQTQPNNMSQIEKTLQAIENLQNEIDLLIHSGELSQQHDEIFSPVLSPLVDLKDDLEDILNKPTKKKNLITGEFSIRGGYYDFKENGQFTIEIFSGKTVQLPTERANEAFAIYLKSIYGVQESDIILNEWYIDTKEDTLQFAFAFQTDLELSTPKNEISLITGKKLSFGSFHQNKMYFRLPQLGNLPFELWNYPCYGFAIPYSYDGNVPELLNNIVYAIKEGGELADLRAISGEVFKAMVDSLVANLQSKKWKSIFTAWGKYKLQPNGTYLKY